MKWFCNPRAAASRARPGRPLRLSLYIEGIKAKTHFISWLQMYSDLARSLRGSGPCWAHICCNPHTELPGSQPCWRSLRSSFLQVTIWTIGFKAPYGKFYHCNQHPHTWTDLCEVGWDGASVAGGQQTVHLYQKLQPYQIFTVCSKAGNMGVCLLSQQICVDMSTATLVTMEGTAVSAATAVPWQDGGRAALIFRRLQVLQVPPKRRLETVLWLSPGGRMDLNHGSSYRQLGRLTLFRNLGSSNRVWLQDILFLLVRLEHMKSSLKIPLWYLSYPPRLIWWWF